MSRPSTLLVLATLAASALLPAASRASRRPDILFVSFDTLRRDHVSCYGHDVLTTPAVDGLAARGVRFLDCQAVVPLTGPSHATMMTGLYPQMHGAFRNGIRMVEDRVTLAQILKAAGYETGAVVSGWTLRDRACGLARGFATYDDTGLDERYGVVNLMRRADVVTDDALEWADAKLRGEGRPPYFLFVHYFDPHEPYDAPGQDPIPPNPASDGGPERCRYREQLPAYDREIRHADRELGRLLDGLTARGLLGDAIVVFTADHGQSFGENGYGGPKGAHGRRVYQSCIAAPLVITWRGELAPHANRLPVSHLDLLPTLVSLAGLPQSVVPLGVQGSDLAAVLRDPSLPPPWGRAERVRYAVTFPGAVGNKWNIFRWAQNKDVDRAKPIHAAAIVGTTKVVVDPQRPGRVEVYDLAADPGETTPLPDAAGRWSSWEAKIAEWFDRTRAPDVRDQETSTQDMQALKSLGYVD